MKTTITKDFQKFINNVGISLDEILQKAEIPNILWKEELILSKEQYYRFLNVLSEYITDEQILMLSDLGKMHTFLPMFYASLCCKDGLDAIKCFAKYKRTIGALFIDVIEEKDDVIVVMKSDIEDVLPRMLIINEQLLMISLIRTGTGLDITPKKVICPYEYSKYLINQVKINTSIEKNNKLVFSRKDLLKPFITHNNIMFNYIEPKLRKQLDDLDRDKSFLGIFTSELYKAIPSGDYSIDKISKSLGLSKRSMQRKLDELGTTFTNELTKIQIHLAKTYLIENKITTEDISLLIGYKNPESFLRAFKKWTGMTITEFKEKEK